jgi:TRAP-type uncharacterized transport system fused permease subunit
MTSASCRSTGMRMPTTPAYIMIVALLVPAVSKPGAVTPTTHFRRRISASVTVL